MLQHARYEGLVVASVDERLGSCAPVHTTSRTLFLPLPEDTLGPLYILSPSLGRPHVSHATFVCLKKSPLPRHGYCRSNVPAAQIDLASRILVGGTPRRREAPAPPTPTSALFAIRLITGSRYGSCLPPVCSGLPSASWMADRKHVQTCLFLRGFPNERFFLSPNRVRGFGCSFQVRTVWPPNSSVQTWPILRFSARNAIVMPRLQRVPFRRSSHRSSDRPLRMLLPWYSSFFQELRSLLALFASRGFRLARCRSSRQRCRTEMGGYSGYRRATCFSQVALLPGGVTEEGWMTVDQYMTRGLHTAAKVGR